MTDHRLDEIPAQVGDHVEVVAAADGRDLQVNSEDNQHDNGHTESGDVADEQGDGHQDLVPALLQVSCQSAQQVAQNPAGDNGGELQSQGPDDGAGDDVSNGAGILAEGQTEVTLQSVLAEQQELLPHGLVDAELLGIVFVHLLDCGSIGHGAHLGHDTGNGVGGHQTGQNEVQHHCHHECDGEPEEFFTKVFAVAFH